MVETSNLLIVLRICMTQKPRSFVVFPAYFLAIGKAAFGIFPPFVKTRVETGAEIHGEL